jgi:hypothetical protein
MKTHTLPALTAEDKPDDVDSYEYLLRLRMDRVKASAVQDQEKAVAAANAAVKILEGTAAATLWLRDLADFEAVWSKMKEERAGILSGQAPTKKLKMQPKKVKESTS